MTWRAEDGGPQRRQLASGSLGLRGASEPPSLTVTTRIALATTMVVADERTGAHFLLRHTAGAGAVAIVERIDPRTLEPLATSDELPGGPVWPGGLAVNDDGSVTAVFGNHAHRLDPDSLRVLATLQLPRERPYNSFVTLPDGHLVTKDFGGRLPGTAAMAAPVDDDCELLVLAPDDLSVVASLTVAEPSVARLTADGDFVYVVGDTRLWRLTWDGRDLRVAGGDGDGSLVRYRTIDGQTYGWDCVIAAGAAWFLDNGDGADEFDGSLRGHGRSRAPLHLVRVDLATAAVTLAEVAGVPGGLVANPPVVDEQRGIVVAYDSGNGVIAGFDLDTLERRWQRDQDHASHLVLYRESGELVTGDHADVVVLDITTGDELARADTGLGIQSVVFPMPGFDRDVYVCALSGVARVAVTSG